MFGAGSQRARNQKLFTVFFKMKATQADVAEEEMKGRGKCCCGGMGGGRCPGGGRKG